MAASNINRVIITGNLTRDPEVREVGNGNTLCKLRVAVNTRRKEGESWVDKPNYFDVTVWGAQGKNAGQYLTKGRPVAIDGRLEWREWQDTEGKKRQSVDIVADSVQFLGGRGDGESSGGGQSSGGGDSYQPQSDVPTDTSDFSSSGNGPEDDIPF